MLYVKNHEDFDDLRASDEFHSWADEQPKWVKMHCMKTQMTLLL